jgi:glycosyltransferase involved in cell wall biosynthesis
VRFLEKFSREAIFAAYQAADIFVLSAKFETQPLAILDAMAAGAPFVSTDVGCVRELPGGMVVPSGPETTAAINRLMNDEKLRRELSAQGRTACEAKYDWERVLDAYEALFSTLRR